MITTLPIIKQVLLNKDLNISEFASKLEEALNSYQAKNEKEAELLQVLKSHISSSKSRPTIFFQENGIYRKDLQEIDCSSACLIDSSVGRVVIAHAKTKKFHCYPHTLSGVEPVDSFAILPTWAREEDQIDEIQAFLLAIAPAVESYFKNAGLVA